MRFPVWLCTIALFATPGAASANDSVAETAAGGLVLRQTDDIDMLSEDLYVSAGLVRVRYVFRNRRPEDVRVTVAFPLPDRDLGALGEGDVAWPADFATEVDGRPVEMRVERRALLGGVDHGALLAELGVPIAADNIVVAASEAIDALTPEQQRRLVDLGLVRTFEYDAGGGARRYFEPVWTVRETWHWEQVFPAGRDLVVEHRYTPGVGGTIGTVLAFPEMRGGPGSDEMIDEYCVDDAFLRALDRMVARGSEENPVLLVEQRIRYVLTTGANWRSPIADFRLVVDKGRPENIVSFCGSGLTRLDSTRFEMRRRDWRPDRDLAVLIIVPSPD